MCLSVVLVVALVLAGPPDGLRFAHAAEDTVDAGRLRHLLCCAVVSTHWGAWKAWHAGCAEARAPVAALEAHREGVARTAGSVLRQRSRPPKAPDPSRVGHVDPCAPCAPGVGAVSRQALEAYLQPTHLCATMPRTHLELAYSAFGDLLDENPMDEDALVDAIHEACAALTWRDRLHGLLGCGADDATPLPASVHDAQALVCGDAVDCPPDTNRRVDGDLRDL